MNTYNEAELKTLKLADITDLYNTLAKKADVKQVNKFRDKPTAVKRTLEIQNDVAAKEWEKNVEAKAEEAQQENKIRDAVAKPNKRATDPKLTKKEHVALMAIAQNGLDQMGGEQPADLHSDNFSWFDNGDLIQLTGMSKHQCSGIIAALEEKGLIVNSEEAVNGEGAIQWFMSNKGIDLAQSLKDQPLPEVAKTAKKEAEPVEDNVVTLGKNTPKAETSHGILITIVQNNGGEMLTSELAEQFAEEYALVYKGVKKVDISFAKGYIKGAIRKAFLK